MDVILAGLSWKICLCYLYDVIIATKTLEDHLSRLDMVFERIKGTGLTIIGPAELRELEKGDGNGNYSISELECVVLKQFRMYVWGLPVTAYTDHHALFYLA